MGWQEILLGAYSALVLFAIVRLIAYFVISAKIRPLHRHLTSLAGVRLPKVSVIVAAKDEEEGIEVCVRRLLDQDYPDFEVIVVDDRSRDRTAEIVEGIARGDSRLRLVRVSSLPAGWTGKTHALHVGQRDASGEWLVFVDADTHLEPACLSAAVGEAAGEGADFVTLLPRQVMPGFWERVVQPMAGFCLLLLYPLAAVNRDQQRDRAFGNGQFLMVRRAAYDAVGGHERVRDQFLEDVYLARAVATAGYRVRTHAAMDLVSLRMFAGLNSLVRGWSRIFFATHDGQAAQLWRLLLDVVLFGWLAPVVIIAAGMSLVVGSGVHAATFLALGVVHELTEIATMATFTRRLGGNGRDVVYRPLAVAVMTFILARAIYLCWRGKVEWRGTSYSRAAGQTLVSFEQARAP